jgi:hypothetical protein
MKLKIIDLVGGDQIHYVLSGDVLFEHRVFCDVQNGCKVSTPISSTIAKQGVQEEEFEAVVSVLEEKRHKRLSTSAEMMKGIQDGSER